MTAGRTSILKHLDR